MDKRLRDIEAELRQPAKFKEPSAAERARKPRLRDRRKAKQLRKPVPGRQSVPAPTNGAPARRSHGGRRRGAGGPGRC